jgi:hypothetical protein
MATLLALPTAGCVRDASRKNTVPLRTTARQSPRARVGGPSGPKAERPAPLRGSTGEETFPARPTAIGHELVDDDAAGDTVDGEVLVEAVRRAIELSATR